VAAGGAGAEDWVGAEDWAGVVPVGGAAGVGAGQAGDGVGDRG
jgi:hypothetical protein